MERKSTKKHEVPNIIMGNAVTVYSQSTL